jgi:hypothetical protein
MAYRVSKITTNKRSRTEAEYDWIVQRLDRAAKVETEILPFEACNQINHPQ